MDAVLGMSALSLLRSAATRSPAMIFVQSASFSTVPKSIFDAILTALSKPDMARVFNETNFKAMQSATWSGEGISANNSRHIALVETIVGNRDRFPTELFFIETELEHGAIIKTTIPASGTKSF